jgi:bifunctional non-homologous end joining protein LigD
MEGEANRCAIRERVYGMKKHHAKSLHYDLRLEWNGVLLSWALPEGPSLRAGAMRTAVEVGIHNRAYLSFEGLHDMKPIMLWDRGTWEPQPEFSDVERALHEGVLHFRLHGEKLKGGWTLTRTNRVTGGSEPVWTLCKQADSFAAAESDQCVLEMQPNSISTGRTMEEIVRDWTQPRNRHERQEKLFS